ncbi:MAG TPA: hypothetical protein PKI11_07780 [Candidatus Hydrogenedentes bacterium]|nr:hypothetical protein [Candidatus Hydrogenedentota bacterium]HNT89233.1 hypothetical protein [Candidatus Hydrogenedentota bacterium]
MRTPEERQLAQCTLTAGEHAAAHQMCVCMQYADTLRAVALRMTGNKAQAESLVQEAYRDFLRANGPSQPVDTIKFNLLSRLRECFRARGRASLGTLAHGAGA